MSLYLRLLIVRKMIRRMVDGPVLEIAIVCLADDLSILRQLYTSILYADVLHVSLANTNDTYNTASNLSRVNEEFIYHLSS